MTTTYEPPLSMRGGPLQMGNEPVLFPGVRGYAIEGEGLDGKSRILIPLIIADPEGAGNVGMFLDCLSPRCVIPNVTSERLRGMLQRRGFRERFERDECVGCGVGVWVRGMEGEENAI